MKFIHEVIPSRTDTTSTNIPLTQPWGQALGIRAGIRCTAVSGTPSMTVKIQSSADDGTNWDDVLSFTAITAISNERKQASVWDASPILMTNVMRVNVTISGGTPSLTWELHMTGKQ